MIQHQELPAPPKELREEIVLSRVGLLEGNGEPVRREQLWKGGGICLLSVTEGNLLVWGNGVPYDLRAGEVLLAWELPLEVEAPPGMRGNFALVEGPLAARCFSAILERPGAVQLGRQAGGLLGGLLRTVWNTWELGAAVDGYWCCARAFELTTLALAAHQTGEGRISRLVEAATMLMRTEFAYLEGMDDLADRLGVSKCHLIRRFKEEVGVSPGKYLVGVRVSYAKLLLRSGRYRLETVADMVGIAGANYFCKVFKRETGLTPDGYAASVPRLPLAGAEQQLEQRFYL